MTFNDAFSIERELAPGERLLWKGQPQKGIKFRSQDWFGVPFSLVWFGGVAFGGYNFMQHQGPQSGFNFGFLVFGFMGTMGLYLLVGRFLSDAYTRSRMEYALTDRRALILSRAFTRNVRSIDYRTEPDISLSERSGGSGTIYFGRQPQGKNSLQSSGSLSAFDMIDNARDVYQRILKAKSN
jgi:hypothetical protein